MYRLIDDVELTAPYFFWGNCHCPLPRLMTPEGIWEIHRSPRSSACLQIWHTRDPAQMSFPGTCVHLGRGLGSNFCWLLPWIPVGCWCWSNILHCWDRNLYIWESISYHILSILFLSTYKKSSGVRVSTCSGDCWRHVPFTTSKGSSGFRFIGHPHRSTNQKVSWFDTQLEGVLLIEKNSLKGTFWLSNIAMENHHF